MSEKTDKISGRAKQAAGDLKGDDELKNEGKIEEGSADAKEKVSQVAGDIRDKVDDAIDSVKDRLKR
jgi:uncharacterized protein YjbJ (UPF0337 family)